MLNTELVKKDEDDFDEWQYKKNFEPMDIIEGLPGYDEGAYYIEQYDPKPFAIEDINSLYDIKVKQWKRQRDEFVENARRTAETQDEIESNIEEEL